MKKNKNYDKDPKTLLTKKKVRNAEFSFLV